MNYSDLSDFEINKRVAALGDNKILPEVDGDTHVFIVPCDSPEIFDPCNNPNDAWPIILEHGISLSYVSDKGKWIVDIWKGVGKGYEEVINDNPLRAACIVFLKMNEGKS